MSNMNNSEIRDLMQDTSRNMAAAMEEGDFDPQVAEEIVVDNKNAEKTFTRNVLVIGCGGGGCNIASAISLDDDHTNTYVILYDTVKQTLDRLHCDHRFYVTEQEGTGKSRDLSKGLFRTVVTEMMSDVTAGLSERDFDYILITTTADGGTGSGMSITLARFLRDNLQLPIVILGVLPSETEDQQACFNALTWQGEVIRNGFPYILMDNALTGLVDVAKIHTMVNEAAVRGASLLTGKGFGITTEKQIDRMNLQRLTQDIGQRIVAVRSTERPTSGQTLDDYIEGLLATSYQPAPEGCTGIGLWVKGPKNMFPNMDTSLRQIQAKYCKNRRVRLKFDHLEESDLIDIGAIFTGCDEAKSSLEAIRHRYDDASGKDETTSVIDELTNNLRDPGGVVRETPRESTRAKIQKLPTSEKELDMSAFD